jgi:hypothetical protein
MGKDQVRQNADAAIPRCADALLDVTQGSEAGVDVVAPRRGKNGSSQTVVTPKPAK